MPSGLAGEAEAVEAGVGGEAGGGTHLIHSFTEKKLYSESMVYMFLYLIIPLSFGILYIITMYLNQSNESFFLNLFCHLDNELPILIVQVNI